MTREELIDFGEKFLKVNTDPKYSIMYEFVESVLKLLKQDAHEDAVSRAEAIDAIKHWFSDMLESGKEEEDPADVLNRLPSVEPTQRWIPCSERLPKEIGFYLVSTTDCITIMEFCKGWISQNIGSCNWYVKAWQPLPKPYKEESEVKA